MEIFILVVAVFYVALKCLIDMSQILFINNYKMTNDEINKLELNTNDYNEARDYNKSKLFLSLCKLVIEALVIYTFIISDGLLWMNDNIALHNLFIPHEYILLIIFFTLLFAIKLPLSFYSTFYIESNENKPIKKSVFELTEKSFDNDIILDEINLGEVLMETISLETPDYPKKSGASISLAPTESIDRENPFSILSKLKK